MPTVEEMMNQTDNTKGGTPRTYLPEGNYQLELGEPRMLEGSPDTIILDFIVTNNADEKLNGKTEGVFINLTPEKNQLWILGRLLTLLEIPMDPKEQINLAWLKQKLGASKYAAIYGRVEKSPTEKYPTRTRFTPYFDVELDGDNVTQGAADGADSNPF